MKPDMRTISRALKKENEKWPWHLVDVPRETWPDQGRLKKPHLRVMRSRDFLVQIFDEGNGIIRLSINRSAVNNSGGWTHGITWDELQQLKFQSGYGDCDAVEVFPAQADVVNVANMRHLFVYANAASPSFIWRSSARVSLSENGEK